MMKPILFSTEMVRAILEGRKTVTRRVVRGAWPDWSYLGLTDDAAVTAVDRYGEEYPKPVDGLWAEFEDADGPVEFPMVKTPYHPGDILWVRETWSRLCFGLCTQIYVYRASEEPPFTKIIPIGCHLTDHFKWRPSIHMPREAARIWLRVTDVRVERLQEIDDDGVISEGLNIGDPFDELWDSTIKHADLEKYGWAANPFCWVIEFEKCQKPEEVNNGRKVY